MWNTGAKGAKPMKIVPRKKKQYVNGKTTCVKSLIWGEQSEGLCRIFYTLQQMATIFLWSFLIRKDTWSIAISFYWINVVTQTLAIYSHEEGSSFTFLTIVLMAKIFLKI